MDLNGIALVAGAGTYIKPMTTMSTTRLTSWLAGSGIGRQVALAMASRGIDSIVCADLNETAARKTADECMRHKPAEKAGLLTHVIGFDITNEESVRHMLEETNSTFGRIDHFIVTAGVSSRLLAS